MRQADTAKLGTPADDVFLKGLHDYLRAHEYSAVTAKQLWAALAQVRAILKAVFSVMSVRCDLWPSACRHCFIHTSDGLYL